MTRETKGKRALIVELFLNSEPKGKYAFVQDTVRVGRDPQSDIVLLSESASRIHFRIERKGETFVLMDNGSKNGTMLNGKRVSEAALETGDMISIGSHRMWCTIGEPSRVGFVRPLMTQPTLDEADEGVGTEPPIDRPPRRG